MGLGRLAEPLISGETGEDVQDHQVMAVLDLEEISGNEVHWCSQFVPLLSLRFPLSGWRVYGAGLALCHNPSSLVDHQAVRTSLHHADFVPLLGHSPRWVVRRQQLQGILCQAFLHLSQHPLLRLVLPGSGEHFFYHWVAQLVFKDTLLPVFIGNKACVFIPRVTVLSPEFSTIPGQTGF